MLSYIASSVAALKPAGLDNAKGLITSQFVKPVDAPAFAEDAGVQALSRRSTRRNPRFDKTDSQGQVGYLTGEALVRVLEPMQAADAAGHAGRRAQLTRWNSACCCPASRSPRTVPTTSIPSSAATDALRRRNYQPIGKLLSFEGKTPKSRFRRPYNPNN